MPDKPDKKAPRPQTSFVREYPEGAPPRVKVRTMVPDRDVPVSETWDPMTRTRSFDMRTRPGFSYDMPLPWPVQGDRLMGYAGPPPPPPPNPGSTVTPLQPTVNPIAVAGPADPQFEERFRQALLARVNDTALNPASPYLEARRRLEEEDAPLPYVPRYR
jgi:hypothetical protein